MAKCIMIQGTMSNVGKSFITGALCRIFRQDGYSCSPFKSQNMALNSFITDEGLEIGRATAMQAECAGIVPEACMNPILLKPTTDTGSQVILNGKAVGNMSAREYFKHRKELIPEIMSSYNKLSKKYDIIVIEGAGSPAELNLKKDDIVNMGMAKLAESPVVLVGDIDRGGVFAQIIGTLSILEPDEFNMVKATAVNKFRGDISLFSEGRQILEEKSRKNVLGVIPYIHANIEEEDSLSEKLENKTPALIDIVVVRLPKISNFTDFDPFLQYEGVSVRYAEKYQDFGKPDLIIIPGTKNTLADMKWLRESGIETVIKRLAENGMPIFGICGGYQMLGQKISDPFFTECGGEMDGIGLLDCTTVFEENKKTVQVQGRFREVTGFFESLSGAEYKGYEIHMGRTADNGNILTENGGSFSGNVYGCYVHGIFDSKDVSERIVKKLYEHKKINFDLKGTDYRQYKEKQYDILAKNVRKNIDMDLLYRIIDRGLKT